MVTVSTYYTRRPRVNDIVIVTGVLVESHYW